MGSEGVCEGLCIAAPMYSRGLMIGGGLKLRGVTMLLSLVVSVER